MILEFFCGIFLCWPTVFISITIAVVWFYKWTAKNNGYWEAQGVATIKPYPFIGSGINIFKPAHEVDVENSKKFGRIYGTYFGNARILNVTDPEVIKMIFIKDFHIFVNRQSFRTGIDFLDKGMGLAVNDDWKRIRSVMGILISRISEKLEEAMLKIARENNSVDIKKIFTAYSIDVLGTCAFGIELDALNNSDHPFVVNIKKILNMGFGFVCFLAAFVLMPNITKPLHNYFMKKSGLHFFVQSAKEVIALRKTNPMQNHVDLLQLLLDAKVVESEVDEDEITDNETQKIPINVNWSKSLREDELVAQCATFLSSGHETVASGLSFVAYNLALNPEKQEILINELDAAWQKYKKMDYEIIHKLIYLDAVISETLRLHSIALSTMRQAKEEYTIPNTGIVIPENSIVNLPIYALHHDAEFFPNPDVFEPERFLPENKSNIQPYTYIPFGLGPRNCVAMRFALMEMKFCLAHVLHRVRFSSTNETKEPLKFYFGHPVLNAKKIILKIEERNS